MPNLGKCWKLEITNVVSRALKADIKEGTILCCNGYGIKENLDIFNLKGLSVHFFVRQFIIDLLAEVTLTKIIKI